MSLKKLLLLRFGWSALVLILANFITIVFAIIENWDFGLLIWIYWSQSVIIGISNFIKILRLKDFSTEGFMINNRSVAPTERTKIHTAFFFLLHYGFFHFIYFIFLFTEYKITAEYQTFFFLTILVFLGNHLFSLLYHRGREADRKPNIGTMMFFPYARIIPMHLIIIGGFFLAHSAFAIVVFLGLKTLADLIMHAVEHSAKGVLSSGWHS